MRGYRRNSRVLQTLMLRLLLAKEAGFDVSKADWLKYQAKQTIELSDEELEGVAGGTYAYEGRCKVYSATELSTW